MSSWNAIYFDMPESWRELYPFESHFHTLSDNTRLHFVDESACASPTSGPLLMVHGNPTWSFYWRNLIAPLRQNHRCVAVDHVGCGLSDKPQQYHYALSKHIDNLTSLIDALDLKDATLLAHDWGGAIGLGAVLARRDRFRRVVLFNTGAFPPHFIPFRIRVCRTPLIGRVALRGLNLFARAALTMASEKPLPAQVKAGMIAPYDSWSNRVAIWRFVRDIPLTRHHETWSTLESIESRLPEMDMPVDLIWGMKDWCFDTTCLERFQSIWPHASTFPMAEAGHYVVEDAVDDIVPLLKCQLGSQPQS